MQKPSKVFFIGLELQMLERETIINIMYISDQETELEPSLMKHADSSHVGFRRPSLNGSDVTVLSFEKLHLNFNQEKCKYKHFESRYSINVPTWEIEP